jgi:hypothetical protein
MFATSSPFFVSGCRGLVGEDFGPPTTARATATRC